MYNLSSGLELSLCDVGRRQACKLISYKLIWPVLSVGYAKGWGWGEFLPRMIGTEGPVGKSLLGLKVNRGKVPLTSCPYLKTCSPNKNSYIVRFCHGPGTEWTALHAALLCPHNKFGKKLWGLCYFIARASNVQESRLNCPKPHT